jgi:hypothetical protein
VAKLKDAAIGQADLLEYLNTSSDFAFELRCLERLSSLGFQCQHGGSYTDPVTKKTRQFDIRAQKSHEHLRVRCAVECKNLVASFPLLVMCVPRPADESFHELILSFHPDMVEQSYPRIPAYDKKCQTVRVNAPHSAYTVGGYVGKSCAQVGKAAHDDSIVANDAEVFEKWSQALASADDLADDATEEGEQRNDAFLSLILPILVVPDGMLWQTNYESTGTRKDDPVQTDRCSFFVGQYYSAGFLQGTSLTVSHLEFVTLTGLETLLSDLLVPNNAWFPVHRLFGESDTNTE